MQNKISFISYKYILGFFAIVSLALMECKNNPGKTAMTVKDSTAEIYTCAMHPQILEHHPGKCPICGMTLVKKENANREISQVDLATLLQPTNSLVVSSIPVTTLKQSAEQIQLEALGSIEYDTRFEKIIAARISGRIEKLYIKYRYQHINKGDKVMDIYSPELLTGEQNLLFLLKNDATNTVLINAAKQRLLLLGMSSGQLNQFIANGKALLKISVYSNYSGYVLEAGKMNSTPMQINTSATTTELSIKEGMYVEKGQPVFKVYNTDKSWVTLNLFGGDNSFVKVGTPVLIIPETAPDKKISAAISFIEPFYRNNNKTVTARVYFNNSTLNIPVGSQVKANINTTTKVNEWLPQQAVLSLGLNKVVLLKKGNAFIVHKVSTGITTNDLIEITNGLNNKDSVAANAQFLMDSESFIKVKQ